MRRPSQWQGLLAGLALAASAAWAQAGAATVPTPWRERIGQRPGTSKHGATRASLTLRHDLDRRWQIGLNLGWLQRQSTISGFDFTRQLASVVLSTGL